MSGWSVYTRNSGSGGWSIYRMGAAAAATSTPGGVAPYGMAYDLSTLPMDDEQFANYARIQAEISQRDLAAKLQQNLPAAYSKELEIAQNKERYGYTMENESLGKSGGSFWGAIKEDLGSWTPNAIADSAMTEIRMIRNKLGQAINLGTEEFADLTGAAGGSDDPSYDEYASYGGILSQEDYEQFSAGTRAELRNRAQMAYETSSIAKAPGISQLLQATTGAYKGLVTGIDIQADVFRELKAGNMQGLGMYFDGSEWSRAWREADERSLGNALVDTVLTPFVSENTLDDWRKNNALYQMTSFGTEFTVGWYLDAGVAGARLGGNAMRVARNEMPLNPKGRMYSAIRQAQQGREIISVKTPLAKTYANWRAERILDGKKGVEAYAKSVDEATFARLPMFNDRAASGQAGALALHSALNSGNDKLVDLSWRIMDGDVSAWAQIRRMKEDPAVLSELGGGARTYLDALEATKTKIPVLEQEILDLTKAAEGDKLDMFHRWEIHADIATKEASVAKAKEQLASYGDEYAEWLTLMSNLPHVNRYSAPKSSGWSDLDLSDGERPTHRFYMNNQYGYAHRVTKLPKAAWLKKTNTAAMSDFDSGTRAITRSLKQWNQILDFQDIDGAVQNSLLQKWAAATTDTERYKVLWNMEEEYLVPALAAKLEISEKLARKVMKNIDAERTKTIRGMMSGKGRIYSTAPSTAARLTDQNSTVRLVSEADDEGMVTLELMDGNVLHTVTVHKSSLVERVNPNDPTQLPNYYQPADVRRLYLEMKRHKKVLDALDSGFVSKGLAEAAEINDIIGTKFYSLWKPAQLWRLGWPQRVLMDEGLRAMAVYGPAYWLTGSGAEAITTAARNIPSWMYEKYNMRRTNNGLGIPNNGPGPLRRSAVRDMDPFAADQKAVAAPQIRASEFPKINQSRYNQLQKTAAASSAYNSAKIRYEALARELRDGGDSPELAGRVATAERLMQEAQGEYSKVGKAIDRIKARLNDLPSTPEVFDPTTGKTIKTGFFVPLSGLGPEGSDLARWFEQNADLLSRSGIRVMVSPDGKVEVGRLFTGRGSKARGTIALKEVAEQAPIGSTAREMYDLAKKEKYVAEDVNKFSDEMEELYRNPDIPDPIPEERIIRYGRRNPMIRQLDEAHARGDLDAEQALMDGLGLRYRTGDANAFGHDWYEIAEPGKFNRMFDEAEGMNRAVDWAAAANGDLRAQEAVASLGDRAMDIEDFDLQLDSKTAAAARALRKEYGTGSTLIRNPDGSTFEVPNVFEGHQGELMRGLMSSNKVIDDLMLNHANALKLMRMQANGHKVYSPPKFTPEAFRRGTEANKKAVRYFHQWADLVNNQIGNSPIWHKMLEGQSDDAITRWLIETADGADVRRQMGRLDPNEGSVALWVNEHRAALNMYVPSKRVQRLLAKGRIEPSDLRRSTPDDLMPDVFGPDVELLESNFFGRLAESLWHSLGTVPIDALSRHPFAKATYDTHIRSLIRSSDSKWIDDAAIKDMQKVAYQHTINEVRKTLFDLTDATNMTDALRFIAPFWNAQSEAITKWIGIIADRPETVVRFFNGNRAIYKNFIIEDEEGNEVEHSAREGGLFGLGIYHPTDRVILNVPDWARKGPLGKSLEAIGTLGIPMGSANTVLQGEFPLFPSTGPYITIPVDKFMRAFSDTYGVTNVENDAYRWMFPIGRPSGGAAGIMEQLVPGWGRRVMGATGPEDSVARANLFWQVGREMQLEAQKKGEKPPTNAEIEKAANWLWRLRIVTGMVSPVQVQFRPKNQMWVDEAHRYRQEIGADWFDAFVEEYGKEAAIYAISSSNSVAGVPPTTMGMEEWAENKTLIQKYPHWGEAIISPEAYGDDYNQDAYRAQFEINLGPGDARTLRNVTDPNARQAEAETRLGWLEFRKFSAGIDAELFARGLTNIAQENALDLRLMKAQFLAELSSEYPAWRTDYDNRADNMGQLVAELQSFAFNKEFDKRPDFQGVRQYLIIRNEATQILDQLYATGGSRSLQNTEDPRNVELRRWFYDQVGSLIEANPSFGEFYSRFLDGDTLMKGSG